MRAVGASVVTSVAAALRVERLALLLILLALGLSIRTFPGAWLDNRVHAFALAGFSLWLLLRGGLARIPRERGSLLVVVPLGLLSVSWAIGMILNVQLLHQVLLPVLLFVWWYAVSGESAARAALPAALVAMLTTPFWGAFVRPLQSITVLANRVLLSFTGIEAQISGDYIAIPAGVFEVARGCSGANYFESGVVISVVYSLMFLRHWRARVRAVVVGALLAAVSNWIRVFGLILIGQATDMQSPLIKVHNGYGWVIFAVVFAGYFAFARRFERYDDGLGGTDPRGPEPAETATSVQGAASRLLTPTLAALAGPVILFAGLFREPASLAAAEPAVPGVAMQSMRPVGDDSSAAWTPAFRGFDRHDVLRLAGDSAVVQVDRLIYAQEAQGKEMISGLNILVPDSVRLGGGLVGPFDERGRMANATVFRVGDARWLAWQWYHVSGVNTHSTIEAKLLELPAWFTERRPAEMIVISSPCRHEQCLDAQARLYRVMTGKEPPAGP